MPEEGGCPDVGMNLCYSFKFSKPSIGVFFFLCNSHLEATFIEIYCPYLFMGPLITNSQLSSRKSLSNTSNLQEQTIFRHKMAEKTGKEFTTKKQNLKRFFYLFFLSNKKICMIDYFCIIFDWKFWKLEILFRNCILFIT